MGNNSEVDCVEKIIPYMNMLIAEPAHHAHLRLPHDRSPWPEPALQQLVVVVNRRPHQLVVHPVDRRPDAASDAFQRLGLQRQEPRRAGAPRLASASAM